MKKLFFLSAFCGLSLVLFAQSSFTINGFIKGDVTTVKKVYLLTYDEKGMGKPLDSTLIGNDGRFSFKGQAATPKMLSIALITDPSNYLFREPTISLFVENTSIKVEAVLDSLKVEAKRLDVFNGKLSASAKIKGSKSHQLFLEFYTQKSKMDKERSAIFNQYIKYNNPPKGQAKPPMEEGISLAKKMDDVEKKQKDFTLKYILSNPVSGVLAHIASQALKLATISVDEIDMLTNKFSKAKNNDSIANEFLKNAAIARKIAIGSYLADFTLVDETGKDQKLSNYIGKGRYVLLEFWASWCGPCRADIPKIKESFSLYHPKGFDVVSISLDQKKEQWMKAVKDEQLTEWPQLIEPKAFMSDLVTTYRISAIPACLLFDPNGKLVTRNMRGSWMKAILIDLYGDLFDKKTQADP